MKAARFAKFGPPEVIQTLDIPTPVPKDDQVLLKVFSASINPLDWHLLRGIPFAGRVMMGFLKPKEGWLGADIAGRVEAVGKNVTQFKPGDEAFGTCRGSLAEYACPFERALAKMPSQLTFQQAASLPVAALTALQALRDRAKVQPGQNVLINGASGGVGTFAVQIAKSFGAEVTGVCSSRNANLVLSLGASQVIDYTHQDFTSSSQKFDVIIDNIANRSLLECRRALNPKGKYVLLGGGGPDNRGLLGPGLSRAITSALLSLFISQQMSFFIAKLNNRDLLVLCDLVAAGKLKPVIDRTYRLSEIRDALRYLEAGHARGKVVITIASD